MRGEFAGCNAQYDQQLMHERDDWYIGCINHAGRDYSVDDREQRGKQHGDKYSECVDIVIHGE
ncbi:hypothetical protein VSDG_09434 [Cytospora chrysosperma]|uniref:Uncharacterized protein n=1 Tax=Cytospora chrysosperma TaxID=252740 RepID=A0A423VBL7_CYTCH|nr:hypothetical protein VSDG_09434 [Valsa sordida]